METTNLSSSSRRTFIKQAAWIAGMPTIIPASVLGRNGDTAPSNKIVLGAIGIGPRGREVLKEFLSQSDVQFVAIADVQEARREIVRKTTNRQYGNEDCKAYRDMNEVLARPDIDAVLIATGDRWHAPASMIAARAGKDVYSEKPCTMTIGECKELDDTILKEKRIFQAGTQRRNVDNFRLAVELARTGQLGKLKTLHAGIIKPENDKPNLPGEPDPDPDLVDWDRWLGPCAVRPFNKRYVEGQWRGQEGLAAGYKILEWGSHTVDLCQWAADADGTTPIEFEADGGTIHATYANGIKLVMRLAGFSGEGDWLGLGTCPVRFEGDSGWVEAGDHGKILASNAGLLEKHKIEPLPGTNPVKHVRNFLDCVKSREQPTCNSTVTRYGHVACHAAALSWKLGRKLKLDPVTEMFIGDDEANQMRTTERRAPWNI